MDSQSPSVSAVIVAAGGGLRFGGKKPKQLMPLAGRPILSHTLAAFEASRIISEIILVLPEKLLETSLDEAVRPFAFTKVKAVAGGASRGESTRRGFEASRGEIVLVHDGVRPFVDESLIERVAKAAQDNGAALAAIRLRDTLKEVEGDLVLGTVPREKLWRAQTPQAFRREVLAEALSAAGEMAFTDDIALVERLGLKAAVVEASEGNIKITTPEDMEMAELLFKRPPAFMRCGQGYDLHRLVAGRPLFLCCVEIPFEMGLLGHSDADVMAHALADAILGAACLGDIGRHFSDKDPRWAGASGSLILSESMAKARRAGFELQHADLTLLGERPKIEPYREAMRGAVAEALQVSSEIINIKATTTEGLGPTGEGLALAALAAATLRPL